MVCQAILYANEPTWKKQLRSAAFPPPPSPSLFLPRSLCMSGRSPVHNNGRVDIKDAPLQYGISFRTLSSFTCAPVVMETDAQEARSRSSLLQVFLLQRGGKCAPARFPLAGNASARCAFRGSIMSPSPRPACIPSPPLLSAD